MTVLIKLLGDFFVILAGRDPDSLTQHLTMSEKTERIKLIQLGLTLFVPSLVSLFSISYILSKVLTDHWTIWLATVGYAVIIFLVDRYFILSLRKSDNIKAIWPVTFRIFLAIALGFVVSEPIVVKLFEKSIDKMLAAELKEEIGNKSDPLNQNREQLKGEINSIEQSISTLREKKASVKANTTALDTQIETLKNQGTDAISNQANKIKSTIKTLDSNIRKFDGEIKEFDDSIEKQNGEMKREKDGQRASGTRGIGPNYKRLESWNNELVNNRQKAIDQKNETIMKLHGQQLKLESIANEANPNQAAIDHLNQQKIDRLANQSTSSEDSPEVISLSDQIHEKERDKVQVNSRLSDLDTQIRNLQGKLNLSDRDDVYARSNALWKLLTKEGSFLGQAIFGSWILVFMVIDTLPLVTKLSFRSISDDVVQQLELTDLESVQEKLLADKIVKSYSLDSEFAK